MASKADRKEKDTESYYSKVKQENEALKERVAWLDNDSFLLDSNADIRQMHETLLIAKKGDYPTPLYKPPSIIEERRTDHSRKPEKSYQIIQRMYPESRKVELFGRYIYPGFVGVGLEAEAKTYTKSNEKVYTKLAQQND